MTPEAFANLVFAQTDALSGGAGWAGAGLLGAVLFWLLFKHLPAKDAQIDSLVKRGDAVMAETTKVYIEQLRETRTTFKQSLDTVVGHCKEEMTYQTAITQREFDRLAATIAKLGNAVDGLRIVQLNQPDLDRT